MTEDGRRRRTAVTLRRVAERAGVSVMTVSNVINGTGKCGRETRRRVQVAIRETGYVPNLEARRLAGAAGTRIGLIYPDGRTPFLAEALLAALDAAVECGSQLVVREGIGKHVQDADDLVARAVSGGAEGLLVIPPLPNCLRPHPCSAA